MNNKYNFIYFLQYLIAFRVKKFKQLFLRLIEKDFYFTKSNEIARFSLRCSVKGF